MLRQTLEGLNRQIQEANQRKTEFVTLVSHELRTPLASIMGYTELLLEGQGGPLGKRQREWLGIIGHNADRLETLIDDLLDTARIEMGKIELKHTPLDLIPLIQEVARALRPQIARKGQWLTLEIAEALPAVVGDADRIRQILTNLLSNALKYTPSGGRITIAAREDAGCVRVAVQDTGIGLTPDEQAQLFTPFFRAQHDTTQRVGGTGLGLAITRALVELHGGAITVTSVPGQGSTFSFTLPTPQEPEDDGGWSRSQLGCMIRHHAFGSPERVERSSAFARPINCQTPQRSWPDACLRPCSSRRRKSCEEQARGRARVSRAWVGDASA